MLSELKQQEVKEAGLVGDTGRTQAPTLELQVWASQYRCVTPDHRAALLSTSDHRGHFLVNQLTLASDPCGFYLCLALYTHPDGLQNGNSVCGSAVHIALLPPGVTMRIKLVNIYKNLKHGLKL